MEITAITHTDNTKSVQYWVQILAVWTGISTYQYLDISQKQLQEIKTATPDRIQQVLSKIF